MVFHFPIFRNMKILLSGRVGITGVHRDSLSLTLEGVGWPDGDPWLPLG